MSHFLWNTILQIGWWRSEKSLQQIFLNCVVSHTWSLLTSLLWLPNCFPPPQWGWLPSELIMVHMMQWLAVSFILDNFLDGNYFHNFLHTNLNYRYFRDHWLHHFSIFLIALRSITLIATRNDLDAAASYETSIDAILNWIIWSYLGSQFIIIIFHESKGLFIFFSYE